MGRNGNTNGSGLPFIDGQIRDDLTFDEFIQMALRDKWIILLCFVGILGLAAAFTLLSQPVYESTATVLIDTKGQRAALSLFDMTGLEAVKNVKNELEILNSRSLRETVAHSLMMARHVDATTKVPLLIIQPDEENNNDPEKLLGEVILRLEKSITFESSRGSDAIRITARSSSPEESAFLANAFAKAYQDRNLVASRTRSRAVRVFLGGQLESRKATLDRSEEKLQDYMEGKGIVLLEEESKKIIEQLSQLEAQRDAADIEIQSLRKSLESYQAELANLEPRVARAIGEADDSYIRLLQEQLAKLEVQRDVTIAKNPTVLDREVNDQTLREINDQVGALRARLRERTTAYIAALAPGKTSPGGANDPVGFVSVLKHEIVASQIRLQELETRKKALSGVIAHYEGQFEGIPQKHIQFARLQRFRLSSEKLYLLVEEKYHEAAITEQSEFGYLDIIDPGFVPSDPVSPRVRLNLAIGAMLGLGLGFAFVVSRKYFDVRIHLPEDLKKMGLPPLTAIAIMGDEIKKLGGKTKAELNGMLVDAHLISCVNPLSGIAESYRRLRTNIQYAQHEAPLRTILVTSANPSEGKSTTVSNLAITFAQTGKKTLLVDTDLRKPNLHNEFGVEKRPGLTDVLYDNVSLEIALKATPQANLDLIVCGSIPPNPSETLGSPRMRQLLADLKERYEIILFDSPPVLAVTDPVVLATLADGVVVVTSAGSTRVDALKRTVELLGNVGARLLGTVLNNFDLRKAYGGFSKYKNYSYGYGYSYGSQGNGSAVQSTARDADH